MMGETLIIFKEGMINMLKEVLKNRDFSEDAVILEKAAMITRKDIFSYQTDGCFLPGCQENSLASSPSSPQM